MQRDQLTALTGVLQGALIRRLDPHSVVTTANTTGALLWLCINADRIVAINPFDLQLGKA
jgi:hypothetical protein